MNKNTLVGIVAAVGCVFMALLFDHDSITVLLNPSALILVLGGTMCLAFAIGTLSDGKSLPKVMKKSVLGVPDDPTATVARLVRLADISRRDGLLKLEDAAREEEDPFFQRGVELVVDGKDAETIRAVLEADLEAMRVRHSQGAKILKQAGGFAPTLGIIGTVIGLVHVMTNLSSPDTLGPAIGAAFTATLWGVLSANLFWHPMAAKLARLSQVELAGRQAVVEGLLAIQAGEPPRTVETLLSSYLPTAPGQDRRGADPPPKDSVAA